MLRVVVELIALSIISDKNALAILRFFLPQHLWDRIRNHNFAPGRSDKC